MVEKKKTTKSESKNFAITALVCGILSLVFFWTWPINTILAIVALVFGIIAVAKAMAGRGLAIAGIITGAVGLVVSIACLAVAMIALQSIVDGFDWERFYNILESHVDVDLELPEGFETLD